MHFNLQHRVKTELSLRCILDLMAKGSCQSPRLHRKALERVSTVLNKRLINVMETTIIVHINGCGVVKRLISDLIVLNSLKWHESYQHQLEQKMSLHQKKKN